MYKYCLQGLEITNTETHINAVTQSSHLISVQLTVALVLLSLFLKGKDDESYENVDEEKREHYNKEDVEQRNLNFVVHDRSAVDFCCVDGGLHEAKRA